MAPTYQTKYDSIIVDTDLDTRIRLKQVCSSVTNFGKVYPLGGVYEGLDRLKGSEKIDVVFVSHHLGKEAIASFIKDGKATPQGQDSAYILVMKSNDQDSATVAENVLIGADGFLFEPYSVDSLVEITVLSSRVRKDRAQSREEGAIKFLLNDIIAQLDLLAYSKSCGYEVGPTMRQFKQACTVLHNLSPESVPTYYRIAVDMFEVAPIPQALYQRKKYGGASNRIKKKMAEKLATEGTTGTAKPE